MGPQTQFVLQRQNTERGQTANFHCFDRPRGRQSFFYSPIHKMKLSMYQHPIFARSTSSNILFFAASTLAAVLILGQCVAGFDSAYSRYPYPKRVPGSEFLGKRSGKVTPADRWAVYHSYKRVPGSEFLGKRAPGSEFLGKRVPGSEFLGKRVPGSEFLGKRVPGSEFLGKRSQDYYDYYNQAYDYYNDANHYAQMHHLLKRSPEFAAEFGVQSPRDNYEKSLKMQHEEDGSS